MINVELAYRPLD